MINRGLVSIQAVDVANTSEDDVVRWIAFGVFLACVAAICKVQFWTDTHAYKTWWLPWALAGVLFAVACLMMAVVHKIEQGTFNFFNRRTMSRGFRVLTQKRDDR